MAAVRNNESPAEHKARPLSTDCGFVVDYLLGYTNKRGAKPKRQPGYGAKKRTGRRTGEDLGPGMIAGSVLPGVLICSGMQDQQMPIFATASGKDATDAGHGMR